MTAEEKLILINEVLDISPDQTISRVIRNIIGLPDDIDELPMYAQIHLSAIRKLVKEMKTDSK